VNHDVARNTVENIKALDAYKHLFPDMPIILLGRDYKGKSTYCGQEDIANFLANIDPNCIPWRRFIITD
ncbi:MAG: hypothetical protein Q8911_06590, partial [Bacillota bacterium]|nr:hypothetical protein [Bacillota bacterium]